MKRQLKNQCKAKAKSTGQRCTQPAIPGATVCQWHGGGAPAVRAAAARRQREQVARRAAAQLAIPIDVDPGEAILAEVQRTAGLVAFYEARVKEIAEADREALVWGKVRHKTGGDDVGTTYEARPNVWLQLFNQERDRLVDVAAAALKAGVDERRVRVAEGTGLLVASAIRRILDSLSLSPEQASLVSVVVPRELRALTAEPAEAAPLPQAGAFRPRVVRGDDAGGAS